MLIRTCSSIPWEILHGKAYDRTRIKTEIADELAAERIADKSFSGKKEWWENPAAIILISSIIMTIAILLFGNQIANAHLITCAFSGVSGSTAPASTGTPGVVATIGGIPIGNPFG